jgi:uncharacterized membrane protein
MARRKWTLKEVDEYRKVNSTFFYFNKDDSSVFVPKPYGIGFTVNWANPITWLFILVIVGFIVWRKF